MTVELSWHQDNGGRKETGLEVNVSARVGPAVRESSSVRRQAFSMLLLTNTWHQVLQTEAVPEDEQGPWELEVSNSWKSG